MDKEREDFEAWHSSLDVRKVYSLYDAWQARARLSQWQGIASAPKDGSQVILMTKHGAASCYWYEREKRWVQTSCAQYAGDIDLYDFPTHWMPEPPK